MFLIVAILHLKAHSVVIHVIQTGPVLVPCAAHGQTRIEAQKTKTSHRISDEAVGFAFMETRREASAMRTSSARCRPYESSYVSSDDRFAALLDCHAVRRGEAPPNDGSIIPNRGGKVKTELRIEN